MSDRPVTELRVKEIGEKRAAWLEELKVRWEMTSIGEVVRRCLDLLRAADERRELPPPPESEPRKAAPAARPAPAMAVPASAPGMGAGRYRLG